MSRLFAVRGVLGRSGAGATIAFGGGVWASRGSAVLLAFTVVSCSSTGESDGDDGHPALSEIDWRTPDFHSVPAEGEVVSRDSLIFVAGGSLARLRNSAGETVPVVEHGVEIPAVQRGDLPSVRAYEPTRQLDEGDYVVDIGHAGRRTTAEVRFRVSGEAAGALPSSDSVSVDGMSCIEGGVVRVRDSAGRMLLFRRDETQGIEVGPLRGSVEAILRRGARLKCRDANAMQVGVLDNAGNFSGWRRLWDDQVPGAGVPVPVAWPRVGFAEVVPQLAAQYLSSCRLGESGLMECWGPMDAASASGLAFKRIAVGVDKVCGLDFYDRVRCSWSSTLAGREFRDVALGHDFACGLRADGTVECEHGGAAPVAIATVPVGVVLRAIVAGTDHACGMVDDGTIRCWGDDSFGQLGAPSGTFRSVSAGAGHSCGIRTDGSVTCWGWNAHGQSDGPSGEFVAVAAGSTSSCALSSAGAVTCWGDAAHGQTVVPAGAFSAIASGDQFSCGIRKSGETVCWGKTPSGSAGRLGP
jgi:hypothetical protein